MTTATSAIRIYKNDAANPVSFEDTLANEFVLEMTINREIRRMITCSNCMLEEFVIGHLYSEAYICELADILSIEFSEDKTKVSVCVRASADMLSETHLRSDDIVTTGSRNRREADGHRPVENCRTRKSVENIAKMMEHSEALLRENPWFEATGALHSALHLRGSGPP